MSNMKNGFSTLNRWLGKKNKADKSTPNGKLSKSSTNLSSLSVSTTNINETSQLEYNRITPLPVATSNTAFEQTFRITVLLPKDQLYVARLGARVPLSKLLELVCENKLLDATKFEFRNPVDPSQVYSCDLTIGAVGLSEIRLCHKSESYDSFNADEIVKMHRTPVIRDSLSSSEFSSRYSKHTTKTTSPYSSSNSLNSMDSTGMNCVRTPVSPPPTLPTLTAPSKIAAPPRKKRAAPRPPSQTVILEKSTLVNDIEEEEQHSMQANTNGLPKSTKALPQKESFISTPNLTLAHNSNGIDCNGNATNQNGNHTDIDTNSYESETFDESSQVKEKNARNINGCSTHNLSSPITPQTPELPEPSPRKRVVQQAKKKSAPAPPPKDSCYMDDNISLQSMTPSTPDSPLAPSQTFADATSIQSNETSNDEHPLESPKPQMREGKTDTTPLHSSTPVLESTTAVSSESYIEHSVVQAEPVKAPTPPKPVPRITTSTLFNGVNATNEANVNATATQQSNVSKTMLNRTPTPEPRSLSSEPPDCDSGLGAHLSELKHRITQHEDDDTVSKQADSGIGEPVPSPIPDSLPSEGSTHECKSTFESSSDDDDMVKVYNFKLGTTLTKTNIEPKSLNDFAKLADTQTDSESNTPGVITQEATPNYSDSASWNFTIPISPPPNFADARFIENLEQEKPPDTPITPKIKERPLLNFDALHTDNSGTKRHDQRDHSLIVDKDAVEEKRSKMVNNVQLTAATPTTPLPSPTTPLNDIVDELSAIINDNRMDTLIRKADENNEIEAAKPNTLTNFSIATIAQQPTKATTIATTNDKPTTPKSTTNSNIARADSFESTTTVQNTTTSPVENDNKLDSRSSSQTSLSRLEQSGANLNRRRSSSELSIGESPSLQSLEVIKTILNSRKNSLASSSDSESKTSTIVETTKSTSETQPIATATMTPKNEISEEKEKSPHTAEHNKPKELPKVYRYSGPPSINFSTWNERPKVQVAIKNEGDYIFGGKNADSQSAAVTTAAIEINRTNAVRNNRISMPANSFRRETQEYPRVERVISVEATARPNTPPAISPKPASAIKRMGIPEQEYQVPITVKPLRDVTAVTTADVRTTAAGSISTKQTAKSTRTSSITTVLLNGDAQQPIINTNTSSPRTFTQSTTHTSTLQRSGGANRFSMPASTTMGPALLRSTSITQLEATKPKPTIVEPAAAPFGQNTLRKTGLKEKILAREAEEQQKAKMVADNTASTTNTTITSTVLRNGGAQTNKHNSSTITMPTATTVTNGFTNFNTNASTFKSGRTLQSAKMELKLQNSNNIYINQSSINVATMPDAKKSAVTTPPPPPPPTPTSATTVRSIKVSSSAATTPTSPDPRDQLLAAIRNFKRDELNRT